MTDPVTLLAIELRRADFLVLTGSMPPTDRVTPKHEAMAQHLLDLGWTPPSNGEHA